MSEISSNQSLNKILDQLGINKTKEKFAPREVKDQLGQEDFLKLMTVQLQNQDPFAPVDNADFIAQMAQFSTVTGIQEMNGSLGKLVEEIQTVENQISIDLSKFSDKFYYLKVGNNMIKITRI